MEIEKKIRALREQTSEMITEKEPEEDIEGDDDFDIQLLRDEGLSIDD
jgi:hypothetical protein